MKRPEKYIILGANWRLANAKSSMLQENNPDAADIHVRERGRRERARLHSYLIEIGNKVECFTRTSCLWVLVFFLGLADIDFFVPSGEQSEPYMLDDILALAKSVCSLALSCCDRHVFACCFVAIITLTHRQKKQYLLLAGQALKTLERKVKITSGKSAVLCSR